MRAYPSNEVPRLSVVLREGIEQADHPGAEQVLAVYAGRHPLGDLSDDAVDHRCILTHGLVVNGFVFARHVVRIGLE